MFLFQIVDEGIIQRVVSRLTLEELKPLVPKELDDFLSKNGIEGTTDDGYANIIKLDLTGTEEEVHLWSYAFDGTQSIESAAAEIPEDMDSAKLVVELGKIFWKQELNDDDTASEILELMDQHKEIIQFDEALSKAYRELTIWSRSESETGGYLDTVHQLLNLGSLKPQTKN